MLFNVEYAVERRRYVVRRIFQAKFPVIFPFFQTAWGSTGGPDVVFDFKTIMYENTLKIAVNSTCMKDLNKNVLPYVYLALF